MHNLGFVDYSTFGIIANLLLLFSKKHFFYCMQSLL